MLTRRALLFAAALPTLAGAAPQGPTDAETAPPSPFQLRDAWGAKPAREGGRRHFPWRFVIHHTAGPTAGTADAPATLRGIQSFHMGGKGWVDLAYHYFVDADGGAWQGRAVEIAGDTATNYDPAGSLLVCCLGNFETHEPPQAQLDGVGRLLADLSTRHGVAVATITGHRDLASTLCPGRHLHARVADGTLLAGARAVLAGG